MDHLGKMDDFLLLVNSNKVIKRDILLELSK